MKEPALKAKELYDKGGVLMPFRSLHERGDYDTIVKRGARSIINQIQDAERAMWDEFRPLMSAWDMGEYGDSERAGYWNQVKEELEKIQPPKN